MVEASERTRRRFVRRQWARRWLAWRRLLAMVVALAVLVGGLWLVFFSPYLVVDSTRVEGIEQLRERQVLTTAAVPDGEALARVDVDAIRSRVETLAIVKKASVSRAWPDTVLIEVTERTAIAVVEVGSGLRGMDDEGVLFRAFDQAPEDLPRIVTPGDAGREALSEAADVLDALPGDLGARVRHVEVRSIDQIVLVLGDGRRVEWGSAESSADKARVLPALLQQEASVYDVSVPGQPTTR